jgi:hypothetical protein
MAFRLAAVLVVIAAPVISGLAPIRDSRDPEQIAGPTCGRPEPNNWLAPPPSSFRGEKVPPDLVFVVSNDISRAVLLLARQHAVKISDTDFVSFTGFTSAPHPTGLHPYLVRAVDMGRSTALEVSSKGSELSVFAFNLGCPHHMKTPIIAFLRARPRLVFVEAGGAL